MSLAKFTKPNEKVAHELVFNTAKELAATWYEEAAHDNEFYAFYPSQKEFVKRETHRFIETARLTLSQMLGMPHVPESQKTQIFDALIKHASLPGNIDRRVAQQMIADGDKPSITPTVVH
jgi:hypothetical protein